MHRIWQIPELLIHIISFLPASDINRSFQISSHFRTLLKATLPPQLRPLPDRPPSKHSSRTRALPQEVRDQAATYLAHELATPKQLKTEDVYYYWREGAQSQIFDTLSPCLHPIFAKFETKLVNGYEALAKGKMDACLQTDVPYHELYELVHGEKRDDWSEHLAVKANAVTVFCLGGTQWDLLYGDVRYRDLGGVQRFSVRVEREDGVMLGDVMEELRGTLVVQGMSGGLGQDVTLVLVFDEIVTSDLEGDGTVG
jgi:ribosomal protein L27